MDSTIFAFGEDIPHAVSRADALYLLTERPYWTELSWQYLLIDPKDIQAEAKVMKDWGSEDFHCYASKVKGLIESIREDGIDQPLVLYDGRLEGYHRLAAALYLRLKLVPVYIATC